MAASAEHRYACSGLKVSGPVADVRLRKQQNRCTGAVFQHAPIHQHQMHQLKKQYNMSGAEDFIQACIQKPDPAKLRESEAGQASEACSQMSACASAWNMLNVLAWERQVPQLEAVVRRQHELLSQYIVTWGRLGSNFHSSQQDRRCLLSNASNRVPSEKNRDV